jgi:hypothetical protein
MSNSCSYNDQSSFLWCVLYLYFVKHSIQALSAAAFSVATSAVFYGVGQAYSAVSQGMTTTQAFATKVAMHSVAGCGVSAAGGGSCADGAVSSGVAAGYSFLSDANGAGFSNNNFGSIIEAGIVGGGTRQLLGGSFSEGFEAGAAGQAYNALQILPFVYAAGRAAIAAAPRALAAYRAWRVGRNALESDVAGSVEPNVAQTANIDRFLKKIPANARDDVQLTNLPNEGVAAQASSAGRVPGSKAVYEKQIDVTGKTIQYTKTTYGPDGGIIHVKDKLNGGTFP